MVMGSGKPNESMFSKVINIDGAPIRSILKKPSVPPVGSLFVVVSGNSGEQVDASGQVITKFNMIDELISKSKPVETSSNDIRNKDEQGTKNGVENPNMHEDIDKGKTNEVQGHAKEDDVKEKVTGLDT